MDEDEELVLEAFIGALWENAKQLKRVADHMSKLDDAITGMNTSVDNLTTRLATQPQPTTSGEPTDAQLTALTSVQQRIDAIAPGSVAQSAGGTAVSAGAAAPVAIVGTTDGVTITGGASPQP